MDKEHAEKFINRIIERARTNDDAAWMLELILAQIKDMFEEAGLTEDEAGILVAFACGDVTAGKVRVWAAIDLAKDKIPLSVYESLYEAAVEQIPRT